MSDLSRDALLNVLTCSFRYYDSVDSTNDIAAAWLRDGAEVGSVVIADEQRKGRGRKGRFWYTPPGVALAVSVILKPSVDYASRVSMLGALCVAEVCEAVGCEQVGIKWPNDVQIDGKKVCGVLPEAVWGDDTLLGVVLGMGINVRVQFDDKLAQKATSIETVVGQSVDRAALLEQLMMRVVYWQERIEQDELFEAWRSRIATIGQRVQVDDNVGIAQDVDRSGALFIETADGSIQRVMAGDVSLVSSQE